MDSDNKKSKGTFIGGIVFHIVGIIACGISGCFTTMDPNDGVTSILMLLTVFLYPIFFIIGTVMIANKYYYNRPHWKRARIISGSILLSMGVILFISSPLLYNMPMVMGGLFEVICGIIILANQNKILPEDVALPEEDDDDDDEIVLDNSTAFKRNNTSPSLKTSNPVVHAPVNIQEKAIYKSNFETVDGKLCLINDIEHFSIDDIDAISSVENNQRKGKLFEEYIAKILEYNGFSNISIIGGSGDLGGDIEARKANRKVIIQCKCYNGAVPYRAVQEVFSAARTRGGIPYVITNNHFSKQSMENAEIQGVTLIDRSGLENMIDLANEVLDSEKQYEKRHNEEKAKREMALRMLDEYED